MNPRAYLSGSVTRYHANPRLAVLGQTNAAHQWGCAVLVLALCPDPSFLLLKTALLHDAGELDGCDLSHPFKQANPEIATAHGLRELEYRNALVGPLGLLTARERSWIKLVDRFECVLFVALHKPELMATSSWAQALADVRKHAGALDVNNEVDNIYAAVSRGE